jgi:hypothetical protein
MISAGGMGPTGAQGPQGIQGIQGIQGPSGSGGGGTANIKLLGYEVGAENASVALVTSDITSHSAFINDTYAKTLTEASCTSDAGNQAITVKIGATTMFSLTCVPYGSYAHSGNNSTGYIAAANMTNTAVAAGAQFDISGTANSTTKDIKLQIWGASGPPVELVGYEAGAENASAALVTGDLTAHSIFVNDTATKAITEASCVTDAGSQTVVVKIGATTMFSIVCTPYGTYSRTTTDGTTGYMIATSMTNTAIAAGAQFDLSGTANSTTKDIKLHIWGQ